MAGMLACCALNLCECAACMACSCLCGVVKATLSQAARFGHLLVVISTFVVAVILGLSFPNEINGYQGYTKVKLNVGCDSDDEETCIYRQLIYRASFSLVILFTILAIGSACSDMVNKSFWVIKFGAAIGGFIALWWGDNSFFSGYAEFARVISFVWLLIQGLLFLDLNHDLHDVLMMSDENKPTYLALSAAGLCCVIVGFVFIFMDYTGCDLGMFFAVVSLVLGVATTIISMLDSVNKGLLTPCLMFAYSVFMTWYALLSSPEKSCNPSADSNSGVQDGATITISIITLVILMYCIINGTKILNIFNPDGEGVIASNYSPNTSEQLEAALTTDEGTETRQPGALNTSKGDDTGGAAASINAGGGGSGDAAGGDELSGTPHERVFFHVLMVLVSSYGAMILTNWGKPSGATLVDGSDDVGNESMWLKILSQWIFLAMYLRVLHVSYQNEAE